MSAMKTARTIGSTLAAIAAVVITGIAALMLVPGVLGLDRYVITGGSMSGTFERGALVFEQQVPVDELRVGDVITYLPPENPGVTELVTHRIVSIAEPVQAGGPRVLKTQGDANDSADPWDFTLAGSVQPRVEGWIPDVGWVFIALTDPIVRMLAIGVPAAAIALLFLRDLLRETRRPRPAEGVSSAGETEPVPVTP